MTDYEIEYTIRRRLPGEEDFSDIGFGISGIWDTPDECGHMVLSDIQNCRWETERDMPTPDEIARATTGGIALPRYVPTTEEVRRDYQWGVTSCQCCGGELDEDADQFDRWLATVKAEAWEQGYDAAPMGGRPRQENPYRKEPWNAG